MKFIEKLKAAQRSSNSLVCAGLDPDFAKLPECVKSAKYPVFEFNKAIIKATAEHVCCFKPQIAYYSGQNALDQLMMTMEFIAAECPAIPVILDAKRADIGATSKMYAKEAFEVFKADAVTLNPYMGADALQPFLDYSDKGSVILCRTSNAGAKEVQDTVLADGRPLYLHIAELAAKKWNANGNIMLVAGATFPEELGKIRAVTGNMPLLVPGVGAQGGDVEKVVKNGISSDGLGLAVNSSRGIIYASSGEDFAEAAGKAAETLKNTINSFRK